MRIAIVGFDRQGRSALDYWGPGNEITICDRNPDIQVPPNVETRLGEHYLDNLEQFQLIIRTPGLHPKDIVAANNEHILKKVTTVTEEFFRNCPAPIIGVTGTKGKGTTSTLISKILEAAGKRVHLGGNIGIPPLELLKNNIQPSDYVVLELANYQLIDLHVSPAIAICLMVVPEHLDWHTDLREYVVSKQNLFRYQNDDNLAVFNRLNDLSGEVVNVSPALKVSYEVPAESEQPQERHGAYVANDAIYYDDTRICTTDDVALLGHHNLENACAAIAAVWGIIDGDVEGIINVLKTFKGLPHRLELVRELNGISYYDDSFGTTPDSTIVAIKAIPEPKVLLLGGSDKGAAYTELAQAVKNSNVHTVISIGLTGPAIAKDLKEAGFTNIVEGGSDILQIVQTAQQYAKPGDAVLLSTACASFDMFKNYVERGEKFTAAVQALA